MKTKLIHRLFQSLLFCSSILIFCACGKDDDEDLTPEKDNVIYVDNQGNVRGNHSFTVVDESTFIIDDIRYIAKNGELYVSGYDQAFFRGEAIIIKALDYKKHHLATVRINDDAFLGCTSLTSVTIPEGVTSIGKKAFKNCLSLQTVSIPSTVTSIDWQAFYGCNALKNTYCYAVMVPNTDSQAFKSDSISSASLYVPDASFDAYFNHESWNVFGSIVNMKTGEIKHPEPIVPNNVGGHWFGDMDMFFDGERAKGSEIEFYTNGGGGYDRGTGVEIDYYSRRTVTSHFDWRVSGRVIYITFREDPNLDYAIVDYTIGYDYFRGYIADYNTLENVTYFDLRSYDRYWDTYGYGAYIQNY